MYAELRSSVSILSVVWLVACSAAPPQPSPRLVQPGAPGQPTRVVGAESIASPLGHTAADVDFIQRMIVHHVQALEMGALVADRTEDNEIRLLARRIELSQLDEIEMMRDWLERRGEGAPLAYHDGHPGTDTAPHRPMPGMLTAEEMTRLEAARGAEFDRLFLLAMIRHHQGALVMVGELFSSPGAVQEEEIFQFASHVEADQRIEIARMQRMLTLRSAR